MNKYFIDTNIFLRIAAKEDQKIYQECYSFLELVAAGKIKSVTSHLVLSEFVWTLKTYYKKSKPTIIKALEGFIKLNIPFSNNFDNEISLHLFTNHSVKYIDALIASIPEIYNKEWIVVSYDKDFDKLGVVRKEPAEVLADI